MKNFILVILLVFYSGFLNALDDNYEIESTYALALEKYNNGEYDEAIKLFKEIKKKGVINEYIYNSMLDAYLGKIREFITQRNEQKYKSFLPEVVTIAREAYNLYPENIEITKKYIFILDESGNLKEIEKPLKSLLENNKDDIVGNFYAGVLEYYKRNYKKAEQYFLNVINANNYKNEVEFFILYKSYFNLGQLSLEKRYFFDATYYYEKAKELYPYDNNLLVNLGICYAEILEVDNAIKTIERIPQVLWGEALYEIYGGLLFFNNDNRYIEFAEKYQNESTFLKALSLYNKGKYEDALKKITELNKRLIAPHFYIHYLSYSIYEKLNDKEMVNKEAFLLANKAELVEQIDIAINFYSIIEKNGGGVPVIYWIIGGLYYHKKDDNNAIKYLEKYISEPDANDYLVDSYIKLSYLYYQKTNNIKSDAYLKLAERKAIKEQEKYLVYFYKGLIEYDKKQYSKSIENFSNALNLIENDTKSMFFIAASLHEKKENKKAIEYLEKARKIRLYDPEINNFLAYLYSVEKTNFKDAHRLIDDALNIKPDYLPYLDTKGWIYYNEGEYEKSFEIFNKVETLIKETNENTKGFDEIYYHLSKIYEKMGNKKEAANYMEKIKKNFPASKWIEQKKKTKKK